MQTTTASRRFRFWLGLPVVLLTGCASSGKVGIRELGVEITRRLEVAGLQGVEVEIPFEPSEEMRVWVRERVGLAGEPERRLSILLQALLFRGGKRLEYERAFTRTAQEVWTAHRANCLSFSHLLVGLAREVGVPVYYLRVSDYERFTREQDLVVASEHVTTAYGPPNRRRILEFSDRPSETYRELELLSDLTAVALHYSNRGAEALRSGNPAQARRELLIAVAVDPDLADGWVNLGVAERRLGNVHAAEAHYRKALEVDPRQASAYHNLLILLDLTGRAAEAEALRQVLAKGVARNPYSYISLGDWARQAGRLEEAESFYRRATRFDPPAPEGFAALGELALVRGDLKNARRWLKRAERVEAEAPRVRSLRSALAAGTTGPSSHSGEQPQSQRSLPPSRG